MLLVEKQKRDRSELVSQKLKEMYETCKCNPEQYLLPISGGRQVDCIHTEEMHEKRDVPTVTVDYI